MQSSDNGAHPLNGRPCSIPVSTGCSLASHSALKLGLGGSTGGGGESARKKLAAFFMKPIAQYRRPP